MHPDRITVPRGGREIAIDTLNIPAGGIALPEGTCSVEVVDGPEYGTLVMRDALDPSNDQPYTLLPVGWEHAGQFLSIRQGTTVTKIRCWI